MNRSIERPGPRDVSDAPRAHSSAARASVVFVRARRALGAALALILLTAAAARADLVILKNGQQIEGRVTVAGDTVIVALAQGTVQFPKSEVARIVTQPVADPAGEFDKRLKGVNPKDMATLADLAEWAEAHGLKDRAREVWGRMLALDPEHAEARGRLGYVKVDGEWKPRDEALKAAGLVRYRNEWMTPQEAGRRQAEDELAARGREDRTRLPLLVQALVSDKAPAAEAAGDRLAEIGGPAVAELRRGLDDGRAAMRLACAKTLGRIGRRALDAGANEMAAAARRLAIAAARDPQADVRAACAAAARAVHPQIALDVLCSMATESPMAGDRKAGVNGLRLLADPDAIARLLQDLQTPHVVCVEKADPSEPSRPRSVREQFNITNPDLSNTFQPAPPPEDPSVPQEKRYTAREALVQLTRQDFALSAEAWAQWWRKARDNFQFR